ncbi:MAG TPA: hypothetical protein VF368_03385, partial [Gemmatimonadaceae bacterium]
GALGTDRFIASWPVRREPVPLPSDANRLRGAVVVAGRAGDSPAANAPLPDAPSVVVRVPADYLALLDGDLEVARAWRMSARRAFLHYFPLGYRVVAFAADGERDAAYLLSRSA